jgi:hypothetical protein
LIGFITPPATSLCRRQEEAEAQRLESEPCRLTAAANNEFLHFMKSCIETERTGRHSLLNRPPHHDDGVSTRAVSPAAPAASSWGFRKLS